MSPKGGLVTSVDIYGLNVLIVSNSVVLESSSIRALKKYMVDIFFRGSTIIVARVHIEPLLVEALIG